MDNAGLKTEAKRRGFAEAYFVAPPRYGAETAEKSLDDHIIFDASDLPYDVACVLVRAYSPYPAGERIPPYYINSNLSYHAAAALAKELEAEGVYGGEDLSAGEDNLAWRAAALMQKEYGLGGVEMRLMIPFSSAVR